MGHFEVDHKLWRVAQYQMCSEKEIIAGQKKKNIHKQILTSQTAEN